jgi:2-C-methyl-D-erythritol 4-phosphate cytidylyltransferase
MNAALILSGGTGTRMGLDVPKQYVEVGGRPVISYCLDVFEGSDVVDLIVVVCSEEYKSMIRDLGHGKVKDFADPGENRQLSILSGLNVLKKYIKDDDCVIIHDAARPLVSSETLKMIAQGLERSEAVLPVLPLKDTVYETVNGKVTANLDRSRISAGQAPEGFVFGKYLKANESLLPDRILGISGSMQPALLYGMDVMSIPGDEKNFKITTQEDLKKFQDIVDRQLI